MHKLAALDAGFLYNETPRAPQHIASIQILEPAEDTDAREFVVRLKQLLVSRAHLVPYFTRKLAPVPFELDHPVWVRDEAFHIDNHVLESRVAAPGGRAQLEARIAELHAQPLDRTRPLWELWVLTGLQDGRIAFYNRVHHACLDGVSGQAAVQAIMDETPEPRVVAPSPAAQNEEPRASTWGLLSDALENLIKYQVRQSAMVLHQADALLRLWQRSVDSSKGLGAVTQRAPSTRFNRMVGKERTYATGELPLGDVRSIGKAVGATLNDVFLAICSGGLRSYLARHGELPERSLIAGCPVSLRQAGDTSTNNQVTMMLVSLASHQADPVKRLLEIAVSSRQAKGLTADVAGSFDTNVALPWLPGIMRSAASMMETTGFADVVPPPLACNLVVSNVPGPRQQLYALGAKMLTHYPVSIPVHTQGMNITVQSYLDQLFFGITACARVLPDAGALRDDMLASYGELRDRVLKAPAIFTPREPAAVTRAPRAAGRAAA